ncbi:MAG: cytochrome c maturation protein CcmE [Devosiaceae bacterium]|nr:cytochrome c maturation protein CcmE [Devosiaceae bacterium]
MTRKQKRLSVIFGLGLVLVLATTLILNALRDEIVFFYSPTELLERPDLSGQAVRIGGLVEDGSWVREGSSNVFVITDGNQLISVTYHNLLPDLFREGQGVIAEGHLTEDGAFTATNVLAKHDENYISKEVAAALKSSGQWQGDTTGEAASDY